jgi:hypothetical protein
MLRFFGRSFLRITCWLVILNVAKRNEESNLMALGIMLAGIVPLVIKTFIAN